MATQVRTPLYYPDEYTHTALARSIGEGTLAQVQDNFGIFIAFLGPFLMFPAWLVDNVDVAYRLAQGFGALAFALAAFPAYALARRAGVSDNGAVVAAVLALVVSGGSFTVGLLAEPYAYPLFLLAVVVAVDAIGRSTVTRQLAVIGMAAVLVSSQVRNLQCSAPPLVAAYLARPRSLRLFVRRQAIVLGAMAIVVATGAYIWRPAEPARSPALRFGTGVALPACRSRHVVCRRPARAPQIAVAGSSSRCGGRLSHARLEHPSAAARIRAPEPPAAGRIAGAGSAVRRQREQGSRAVCVLRCAAHCDRVHLVRRSGDHETRAVFGCRLCSGRCGASLADRVANAGREHRTIADASRFGQLEIGDRTAVLVWGPILAAMAVATAPPARDRRALAAVAAVLCVLTSVGASRYFVQATQQREIPRVAAPAGAVPPLMVWAGNSDLMRTLFWIAPSRGSRSSSPGLKYGIPLVHAKLDSRGVVEEGGSRLRGTRHRPRHIRNGDR